MLSRLFERFIAEGNSVLLVEHDMSLVAEADWVVDVGPCRVNQGILSIRVQHPGWLDIAESVTAHYLNPAPLVLNQYRLGLQQAYPTDRNHIAHHY